MYRSTSANESKILGDGSHASEAVVVGGSIRWDGRAQVSRQAARRWRVVCRWRFSRSGGRSEANAIWRTRFVWLGRRKIVVFVIRLALFCPPQIGLSLPLLSGKRIAFRRKKSTDFGLPHQGVSKSNRYISTRRCENSGRTYYADQRRPRRSRLPLAPSRPARWRYGCETSPSRR